jgi:hypothetical protein
MPYRSGHPGSVRTWLSTGTVEHCAAAARQALPGPAERAFHRQIKAIAADLAPGVGVEHGVAIYLTLVLPEIYRTLVIERGWTDDDYERWLADALITQLLRQHPAGGGGRDAR